MGGCAWWVAHTESLLAWVRPGKEGNSHEKNSVKEEVLRALVVDGGARHYGGLLGRRKWRRGMAWVMQDCVGGEKIR